MVSPIKKINSLPIAHKWLLFNTVAVLLLLALGIHGLDVNRALFLSLQSWGRSIPELFWASITIVGDALTVSALLLLLARKYPNIVWAGVIAALLTTVVVQSLKHSLVLPRPPLIIPPDELLLIGAEYQHASFPSGHSTAIWVFVSVWLFGAYHWTRAIALLTLASLVALSRVMVGAHWPVDITTGALIGWLGGWAGVMLAKRWHWGMTLTGQRIIVGLLLLAAIGLIGYDTGYAQAGFLVNFIAISCSLFGGYHFYVLIRYPERIAYLSVESKTFEDKPNH